MGSKKVPTSQDKVREMVAEDSEKNCQKLTSLGIDFSENNFSRLWRKRGQEVNWKRQKGWNFDD